ncbi:MAG: DUF1320 family protein [Lentisphaeria bacterium]|nr:DUF1320 family protein [Lentisphaeria bacterium]
MYASVKDLQLRLGPVYADLYAECFEAETPDNTVPESDLAAAAAEIDGTLGVRYTLPVTAPHSAALLKNWCITLAEELAWARSGKEETPANVKDRVAQVRKALLRVAEGSMLLPGAVQAASGGGSVVTVEGNEVVFGREKMKGY